MPVGSGTAAVVEEKLKSPEKPFPVNTKRPTVSSSPIKVDETKPVPVMTSKFGFCVTMLTVVRSKEYAPALHSEMGPANGAKVKSVNDTAVAVVTPPAAKVPLEEIIVGLMNVTPVAVSKSPAVGDVSRSPPKFRTPIIDAWEAPERAKQVTKAMHVIEIFFISKSPQNVISDSLNRTSSKRSGTLPVG